MKYSFGLEPAVGLGSSQSFCYVTWSHTSSSSSAICPVMNLKQRGKKKKVARETNPNMDLAHIQKHRACLNLGFWIHLSLDSSFYGSNNSGSKNSWRILAREIQKSYSDTRCSCRRKLGLPLSPWAWDQGVRSLAMEQIVDGKSRGCERCEGEKKLK